MQKKLHYQNIHLFSFVFSTLIALLTLFSSPVRSQNFCANETAFFTETFGIGTTPTSHPDIIPSALTYQPTGVLYNEGVYRVINNTQQKTDWHSSPDHTEGDVNGKMLVVNGNGRDFYRHIISRSVGFPAGDYSTSLYIMNVNKQNPCGPGILKPNLSIVVEYQTSNNNWVPLIGSPYNAPIIPLTTTPIWVRIGGVFSLPTTGSFVVQNIRYSLIDNNSGGCGNDFAIDDIKFATCPSGGPLPVEFTGISAKQQGAVIAINWSTASEMNNKYFDVEKSLDGSSNWTVVSSVSANGNSSTTRNYNALDIKPAAGLNYYRVKQVDIDGKFKYSDIVYVKITIGQTSASVISNPVSGAISVDVYSKGNQRMSANVFDQAGKLVLSERWNVANGSTRKTISNNIQRGVYILNILDESGTTIYNGKLVKQ